MNPYQYTTDIKSLNLTGAQEALIQTLISLNDEKELYQMSVKELCAKACVARSTFYTYYDTLDDCLMEIENLLVYDLMKMNEELLTHCNIGELSLDFFKNTLNFIKKHENIFYLFLIKRPNYRFIERWKDGIKYHVYERVTLSSDKKNKELTLEMIASQTIAAYQYWLKNPYDINFSFVEKLIRRTLGAYMNQ